jgi:transketolase
MMRETIGDSIEFSRNIRVTALRMVAHAKASHIGSAFSIADLVAVLYSSILKVNLEDSSDPNRDRLILSKGHACSIVYAALNQIGWISDELVMEFGNDFSPLMTHISHNVAGVEFSSGSLGHGLPFGTGKAMAGKIDGESWRTFVILSDGEMDEGSNWEALMFASHHRLDNLVAIIDYNKLQSLNTVASTLGLEPLVDKLTAFGWSVREVDGHNHQEIANHLSTIPWEKNKPSVLIAHTTKGKGVSFMENKVEWHYKSPSKEQMDMALKELKGA